MRLTNKHLNIKAFDTKYVTKVLPTQSMVPVNKITTVHHFAGQYDQQTNALTEKLTYLDQTHSAHRF